jgi:hypothetical protein
MLDDVKDLLGQRVLVTGILSVNSAGNPLSMAAEDIFVMPHPRKPLAAFYASAPDVTGGLSVQEYISQGWGEV